MPSGQIPQGTFPPGPSLPPGAGPARPGRRPDGTRPDRPRDDQPLRAHWDPTQVDTRGRRGPRPERRRQSALGRFVSTYGWRAYAIPVLVVLTVVLLVVTIVDDGSSSSAQPAPTPAETRNTAVNSETTAIGAPSGSVAASALPAGQLPDGGGFTTAGAKSWRTVPGTTGVVGNPRAGRTFTYTVEVENGLVPQDYSSDSAFGKLVDATLSNPRSWIGGGSVAFRRVDTGTPDFRVSLTSTDTTRELCGYQIKLESSCYYPPEARVTVNEARWVRGAVSYQGDDLLYRQYLINHEVGHAIGYEQHQPCGGQNALAPIMMQQTFGVSNSQIMALDPEMRADPDLTCRANPWPFPQA
ncbi:DUF3152 domain-containing protein [Williamsia deligens]|uniref:DUF3152 domain-containing protein n=1 Tax=Williamsia deligens TaxID=321325 RepID=A0ABW3G1P8_9NOCA|nr:DUF3152 domain-containing protein [Williamsia deligens]MCP2194825.1 Protein of unknown function (DUF3152) [Williamsia deligens]